MADALLGNEPMVAEWDSDAGLYLVRAWVAGPAGTAGLQLRDIEVDIDVAWPSRLAELRIPSPDGQLSEWARPILERLLGRPRLWRLLSGRREQPWTLGGDPSYEPTDGGIDGSLSRVALARQIGNDPRHPALRRGIALLEAATWTRHRGVGLRRQRTIDVRRGAELLIGALDDEPLELDDSAAGDFVAVLERAARLLRDQPPTERRIRTLAAEFAGRTHPTYASHFELAAEMMPATAAAAAPAPGRRMARMPKPSPPVRVDRRTLPTVFEHSVVDAQRVSIGEVEVRVRDERERAAGCWARAFDADGTLVAMSPLRVSGPDAGALLLVSPELIDDLVVDVIDQPGVRRPSVVLAAVEAAIDTGRNAARHERAGNVKEAAVQWGRAAQQWQTAGDVTRPDTARSYASGQFRGGRGGGRIPSPLVADRVEVPVAWSPGRT
jgi:hypothetical protein